MKDYLGEQIKLAMRAAYETDYEEELSSETIQLCAKMNISPHRLRAMVKYVKSKGPPKRERFTL